MSRGGPPPQKGKEEKRSTKLVAHPPLPTQIPPHQEHVVPKCPQMNYPYLKPDEVTEEQATDAQFAQPHVVVTDGNLNATQTKKSNPPSFRNVFSRKSKPRDPDSTSILTITTCSSESTLTTTSTALTIDSANARSAAFMDPSRDTKVNPAPRGARAGPPPQKEKHAGDGFFSKLKLSRKGSKGSMSSNDGQRALGQNQNQNQNQNQEYYLPPQPDFYHRPSIDGAVRSGSTTTHSVGSNDQPDAWFHAAWSLASQPPNPLPSPPPPPCAPQVAGHYYYGLVPPPVPSPHTIPGSMPNKALKQRHMIPKMSFDGLVTSRFAAPIEDVLRRGASVLDIGCGSGSWIMDLATAYPTSRFLGIDISLVLLDDMPSNCSIQLVNNLQFPLPFPDNSFDFIRQHFNLAIPAKDWPTLLLELTRILKPGGWLELAESDMWLRRAGPTCERINQIVRSLLLSKDLDPLISRGLTTLLQDETEFISVNGSSASVPVGWDGRQGSQMKRNLLRFLSDIRPLVVAGPDVTESTVTDEEWDIILAKATLELAEGGQRCLLNWWIAYGRKPE